MASRPVGSLRVRLQRNDPNDCFGSEADVTTAVASTAGRTSAIGQEQTFTARAIAIRKARSACSTAMRFTNADPHKKVGEFLRLDFVAQAKQIVLTAFCVEGEHRKCSPTQHDGPHDRVLNFDKPEPLTAYDKTVRHDGDRVWQPGNQRQDHMRSK